MNRRRSRGYSLIEVLVAIAITSVVLLTVVTLFYVGKRNVYSGKERTYAVAIGTRVLEDLSAMTWSNIQTNFSITNATTLSTITLDGLPSGSPGTNAKGQMVIDNSIARDTTGCTYSSGWTCTNDPNNFLSKWMTEVSATGNTSEKLATPVLGLIIPPRSPSNVALPITTAQFTKVRVYIRWDESATSHRYAFFDTTKVLQ